MVQISVTSTLVIQEVWQGRYMVELNLRSSSLVDAL